MPIDPELSASSTGPRLPQDEGVSAAALHVLRVTLPAAPVPLVLRRDRFAPGDFEVARAGRDRRRAGKDRSKDDMPAGMAALDPADVLRLVGAARRTMRGPLVALLEGPGDPLASPVHVLRALA